MSGPRRPPLPLRGAASHEAEGRGGARGGGVGRVGPLAGWRRLRLLREIGDELVPGVEQFLLVDDVVAVEDGAALVPGQEHGDPLGDVCADQVARGGTPTIVKEAGRHPGRLTGGAPRRAPAADRDPIAVEDERAVWVAACPPSRQRLGDGGRDGEDASHQRLRAPWREPDNAAGFVDLLPSEAEDLLLAPAGIVGEVENVLPRGGQVDADGEVFGVLEEALAGGILAQPVGKAGHGVEPAPVDGEGAHAVEGRGLPVDGAGGRPGGAAGELILADLVGGQGGGPRVAAYDRALVQRGDVTLWLTPEAIATWEAVGVGKRGGQLQYSEVAIETALTLRLIFHLPLRQTEGFLRSIFGMLCLDLSAPDHTTLSRRGQHLDLALRRLPAGAGIHLIVDSTGLSTVGEGEWAAVKHGGRGIRGWKKLHLGVDGSGVIVAHALTGGHVDDATTALDLIDKVEGDVSCLTADAAYDTRGIYEAAGARGATVVIPPTRTATVSGRRPRSPARDRTIRQVQQAGRRQWKKDSGYHQQARMENAFFRYKVIIGESLRARSRAGQETEAILACNILNQMTQLGRPASYAIGR